MTSYRAAVVGCGRIGCGFDDEPSRGYTSTHAGAYSKTPGVELIALADLDLAQLGHYADKFAVPGRYQDYRKMLAEEKLDILSVCTWSDTHREIVEAAVEAGIKTVFCEKPLAPGPEDAYAMVTRCKEAGVLLMVNHSRRFDRFHREVRSYIEGGGLGRIQQASCYYTAGAANTGSHLFDLLRFFFGDVRWVVGLLSPNPSPNPEDPNVDGLLSFESGPTASIQALDVESYTIFEINVLGSKGRLRLTSHGFDLQYEEARPSRRFSGYRELTHEVPPLNPNGQREFMLQAVSHLLECLEGDLEPLSSGLDGLRALEVICALRESAETGGRRVELPLSESTVEVTSR
jgi:predicted dehydrogenase